MTASVASIGASPSTTVFDAAAAANARSAASNSSTAACGVAGAWLEANDTVTAMTTAMRPKGGRGFILRTLPGQGDGIGAAKQISARTAEVGLP